MTNEVARIQDQLRRAFEGDAWHGPSVLQLLADINAADAAARPITNAHSIWELVLHIAAGDRAVANRLAGGRGEVTEGENFGPITETSGGAWQTAIETLRAAHRELHDAIGMVDESRLDEPIGEGMSSVYIQLHGVIQHDLYHAGQIAILKAALRA